MAVFEILASIQYSSAPTTQSLSSSIGCVAKTILPAKPNPAAGRAGRLFSFQSKDFLDELNLPILGKLVYRQLDLDIRRNRLYH